jgi:type I restriction enzyme S subunit
MKKELNIQHSTLKTENSAFNTQNPTLPKGWVWVRLGDICKVQGGYAFKSKDYKNEGIPVLRISNIKNNSVQFDEETVYVDRKLKEFYADFLLRKGDIVIALSGATTGKYGIYKREDEAFLNQRVGRLKFIGQNLTNHLYVFYYLEIIRQNILRKAYGAAQPNISTNELENFSLPVPPLSEQQRIVSKIEELFTKLDAGVDALKKAKEQIKRYRQAVLKYAFEGKLTDEWREANRDKLEPASVLLERIKEERKKKRGKKYSELSPVDTSELPELPKGWVWVRLGEIAEIISGVSFKPIQLCKQDVKSVRILRGGNIQNDNYYLLEDDYFVPKDIVSNDQLLRRYDIILVSSTGSKQAIGKAAIIKEELNNLSVGAFLRIIRIYENIQKKYIGFYFYTLSYRNYIREIVKGVNINNIKDSYLNEMFLPLPPLPEQYQIVEEIERRFSVADEVEKAIDNSLKQAERLRQSILKKAFEGKLVPQDPSDEPAEKLLEKFKAEKEKELEITRNNFANKSKRNSKK